MLAISRMRRLRIERRGTSALEYGLIGGVLALVFGLLFLALGPNLAEVMAGIFERIRGIKSAG